MRFGVHAGVLRRLERCLWRLYFWRKVIISFLFMLALYIFYWRKTFFRDLNYWVKPVWALPVRQGPAQIIPHFYSENVPAKIRCSYHKWAQREVAPRIYDAFTFYNELDLLEIRMKELWDVVDYFVVVEADRNFHGHTERLYFHENRKRFGWAKKKVRHFVVRSLLKHPLGILDNESRMRANITNIIKSLEPRKGDLIISSSADEIPSRKALELLKSCKGYPWQLYLQMKEYLYSFEFKLQTFNWRPHVTTYDDSFFFRRINYSADSQQMLADAGWHCSFCFRYLKDFVVKISSHPHKDLATKDDFLDVREIQRSICEGVNIFDLPPEAYSIKEFISRWGKIPKTKSTGGIPSYVVEKREKLRFLLPGGCIREDFWNATASLKNSSLLGVYRM